MRRGRIVPRRTGGRGRSLEKREEAFEGGAVGLAAVFAELEGLGVFHFFGGGAGIPRGEFLGEAEGDRLITPVEIFADLALAGALADGVGGVEGGGSVGATFGELRDHDGEGIEFLFNDGVDRDDDVGPGGRGFLKSVGIIHEDGVFRHRGHVGAKERDGDHKGGVLHEDAGVAVVGVVVVGAGAEDEVGVPRADEAREGAAVFEGGLEFAVVIVEHHTLDTEEAVGRIDFGFAANREGAAGFAPVADVAVGYGDEQHVVASGGPAGGGAADLEFTIIGVRTEGDDAEFAVVRGRHGDAGDRGADGGGEEEKQSEERDERGGAGEDGVKLHGEGARKREPRPWEEGRRTPSGLVEVGPGGARTLDPGTNRFVIP